MRCRGMATKTNLLWPAWATWALVIVVITCLLTIYAVLRDIY